MNSPITQNKDFKNNVYNDCLMDEMLGFKDSPFPKLKPNVRYRTVMERAGFDLAFDNSIGGKEEKTLDTQDKTGGVRVKNLAYKGLVVKLRSRSEEARKLLSFLHIKKPRFSRSKNEENRVGSESGMDLCALEQEQGVRESVCLDLGAGGECENEVGDLTEVVGREKELMCRTGCFEESLFNFEFYGSGECSEDSENRSLVSSMDVGAGSSKRATPRVFESESHESFLRVGSMEESFIKLNENTQSGADDIEDDTGSSAKSVAEQKSLESDRSMCSVLVGTHPEEMLSTQLRSYVEVDFKPNFFLEKSSQLNDSSGSLAAPKRADSYLSDVSDYVVDILHDLELDSDSYVKPDDVRGLDGQTSVTPSSENHNCTSNIQDTTSSAISKFPSALVDQVPNSLNVLPAVNVKNTAIKYSSGEGPCRTCGLKVNGKGIFSKKEGELSGQWHPECFRCIFCKVKFSKIIACYIFDDEIYCRQHYHELNNSICSVCKNYIEGEGLENDKNQIFHVSCFTCFICKTQLKDEHYIYNDNLPLCTNHDMELIIKDPIICENGGGLKRSNTLYKRNTELQKFSE